MSNEAAQWKTFKRGDHVVVNKRGTSANEGRHGICIIDNTETGFGHKHVEVEFDDGNGGANLRTYELDLVLSAEDFAKKVGKNIDALISEEGYVKVDALSPAGIKALGDSSGNHVKSDAIDIDPEKFADRVAKRKVIDSPQA